MTAQTFAKPSEAPSGGGIAAYEGALCIFTYRGRGEAETDFGLKSFVEVDIDVVAGPPAGTMSTPTKLGVNPEPLTAKPGDTLEEVRIFQGWLKGCFNGQAPGGLVLGIPFVNFEDTKQGKNQPVWKFRDATPEMEGWATAYLQAKAARTLAKPSTGDGAQNNYQAPVAPAAPVPVAAPMPAPPATVHAHNTGTVAAPVAAPPVVASAAPVVAPAAPVVAPPAPGPVAPPQF